jgi:membrane protein DedA with SNARE-associated domain
MFGWLEQFVTNDVARFGLWAVYVTMSLESACIPIPSEIVMPYAGMLVAKGSYTLWQVGLVASFANLTGSVIAYSVGRFGGRTFIERYGRYVFLSRKHLAMADRWFETRGDVTVLVSRMLPAVRTFISLPAGIARMNFLRFCIYSFLGALPWNLGLAYVGIVFTDNWDLMKVYLHKFNVVAYVFMALAVVMFFIWKRRKK